MKVGRGACARCVRLDWLASVWYFSWLPSGNNSVVECDLAKVEVAGSNPVSRSNFEPQGAYPAGVLRCVVPIAHFASDAEQSR